MVYSVYKTYEWPPPVFIQIVKDSARPFYPPTHESAQYKNWIAQFDERTCLPCRGYHGKIYKIEEDPLLKPPVHWYCRCKIEKMEAAFAGSATRDGKRGADFWMKHFAALPFNYISKEEAKRLGWSPRKGNLDKAAPGKLIGGEIYYNRNRHLPHAPGRIWREADINYESGYRNTQRLLYSNDGLLFVTYNHYKSFIQIQ